jgi:Zn-dependent protease
MTGAIHIGRLFGISVRIHFSWLFIFFLVAWSLASAFLPDAYPGWSREMYWAIGIAGSMLLFVSVLIHEFSHSLLAISRGYKVRAITLFLLGGVSEIEEEAARPGEEFWIAFVGPLSSFILAGIAWGAYAVLGPDGNAQGRALAVYLGTINLILGVFNLIPGFPMDGGRVLRSIVWRATGSQRQATLVASNVGSLIGYAFMAVGIVVAFTANFISGLWLMFIGWFIQSSASAVRQQQSVTTALTGKRVRDVPTREITSIKPGTSVQELIERHISRDFERAYAVVLGDTFYGLVTASDVRRLPPDQRGSTPVTEIMTRAPEVLSVTPDEPLESALKKLVEKGVHQLAIVSDGNIVGQITRADVMRVLELGDLFPGTGDGRRPAA